MNALSVNSNEKETALVINEPKPISKWKRYLLPGSLLGCIVTLMLIAICVYFSRSPKLFDVETKAMTMAGAEAGPLKPGYRTTAAIYQISETLLNKPGGYLTNDVMPPSVFLDNMPSWEFGVITELRDAVRSLRNDFSRAQSQSLEDQDLMIADSQFHFDHTRFMLPSTEDEFAKGQAALQRYIDRLQKGEAQFFNRVDNLNFYLATVEKRLGSLSHRLSNSVRESYLRELIYENEDDLVEVIDPTPWNRIDNNFFEARGYIWALIHTLRGVQVDFDAVLKSKNASEMLERIVKKLENAQRAITSPVIFNSSGFGILTNHSLVVASYISRANAAIIDLRRSLEEG